MPKWWLIRFYSPEPSDSAGKPAGEPADGKDKKPDPAKTQDSGPKPSDKPGEPADDPRVKEAREEAIKERKARQELADKVKKMEADTKTFQDTLLKAMGKGPDDDPKTAAENAVKDRDKYRGLAEATLLNSAVIAEAVKQGSHDPEAVAALINRSELKVDLEASKVEGVSEAVKALLKAKPYLASKPPAPPAGGSPAGGDADPKGISQKEWDELKAAAKAGDPMALLQVEKKLAEARKLGLKL